MRLRWVALSAAVVVATATFTGPHGRQAGAQLAAAPAPTSAPAATGPATTRAATRAATRPSPAVLDLIRRLGGDDQQDRDAAQQRLVAVAEEDPAVVDALRQAAADNPDPETRGRAAAAIALIRDHDANDATPITLHLTHASAADAFAQLGKQARAEFGSMLPGMPLIAGPGGPANRTVTIDADRQPFWVVMADACTQLGLCPMRDMPGRNRIRLFPTAAGRNWMTAAPHQIVGPFWVSAVGLSRSKSITLVGDRPTTDDQFWARFVVFAEPKLVVTQMSGFNLVEATDDAGNNLLPPPSAAPAAAAAFGGVLSLRSARYDPRTAEARLAYPPENPGKRIALLRGEVAVTLGQDVHRLEAENLLATVATITRPLPGCVVRLGLSKPAGLAANYSATLQVTRDGMADAQWYAMVNRFNDIVIEDADGRPLTCYSWSLDSPDNGEQTVKGTGMFTRTMFSSSPVNRAAAAGPVAVPQTVGEPARLVWNVVSRFKTVTVPVTFKDLPMP